MPRSARSLVPMHPLPQDRPFEDAVRDTIEQWREDLLAFHDDALAEDGGSPGIRDWDALAAAAARPFTVVGDQLAYPTGLLQATVLFKSVVQYHPFVDATKRTAFTATLYFLWNCGYWPRMVLLSRQELDRLEQLVLWVSREREDREASAPAEPYEIPNVARRLNQILGPSRRRRGRLTRLRSHRFRHFFGAD